MPYETGVPSPFADEGALELPEGAAGPPAPAGGPFQAEGEWYEGEAYAGDAYAGESYAAEPYGAEPHAASSYEVDAVEPAEQESGEAADEPVSEAEWQLAQWEAELDDAAEEGEGPDDFAGEGPDDLAGEEPDAAPSGESEEPARPAAALGARIAAIAEQECNRWGDGARKETDPRLTAVLQDYYRTGVRRTVDAADLQSVAWQAHEPWSAVFVSWVMAKAGAATFPRSSAHRGYISAIKRRTAQGDTTSEFWLHRLERARPEPGDILCADRPCGPNKPCNGATYDNIDNGHGWCTHGDIVTAVDLARRTVRVVGGNVDQSVHARTYRLDAQGFVLPKQGRCGHFALIKVRAPGSGGAAGGAGASGLGSVFRLFGLLPPDALAKAMRLNRSYGERLGWRGRIDSVARLLGDPQLAGDEVRFAHAVAQWQGQHGMAKDGIVGPDTWAALRRLLDAGRPAMPAAGPAPAPAPATAPPATAPGVPPLGGDRQPSKDYTIKYRGKGAARQARGLARYSADRPLAATLNDLRRRGVVTMSEDILDTFVRVSQVETGGAVQALNTWDSAVVSIGFLQLTLQHGKLQEWIDAGPEAFRRFGIEVDRGRTYRWGKTTKRAIVGAATKDELRWDGWAERFYLAGLDEAVIVAECVISMRWLERHLSGMKAGFTRERMGWAADAFRAHYDRSPYVRGMFQSAYNNLPVVAQRAVINAMHADHKAGGLSTERFIPVLADAIKSAFASWKTPLPERGVHVVEKTRKGLHD
ncbi:DUF2272 domain-containing protein [Streptomyces sp. NBC_01381]|uniref:DUF2272 domain-containing protein n=1 Tax=Streptomyces sp. NBC_01381 TaxID=2903845 RepID=UPI002259BA84|nr:DUF2272 domain-containing protein [Streptomyces sp. NBC_01381]MCX4672361.1 DUF2272 domain-containing protein [Streptomyces sp. NBC_01381]